MKSPVEDKVDSETSSMITVPSIHIRIKCPHSPCAEKDELIRKIFVKEVEYKKIKRVKWTPELNVSDIARGNVVFVD